MMRGLDVASVNIERDSDGEPADDDGDPMDEPFSCINFRLCPGSWTSGDMGSSLKRLRGSGEALPWLARLRGGSSDAPVLSRGLLVGGESKRVRSA